PRLECGPHHIHPDHHPRPAPVRGVVHLAGLERRGLTEIHEVELGPERERVRHMVLRPEPVEPVREEGDDVDRHPRNPSRTRISPAPVSTRSIASDMNGTSTPSSSSSTEHDSPSTTWTTRPCPGTLQPTRSDASHSSSASSSSTSSSSPRSGRASSIP